jgi:choline-sulfatase
MAEQRDRPNILFIMTDQHRADHVGAAGAGHVRTPILDRLARRGVLFTQCITNSPVSAPARIGLAAGLEPSRVGSLGNDSFLPLSVPTYYQRLRDCGFRVGCVGKLDLAKPDPYNGRYGDRPCGYAWGFTHPEETEGKMHAASAGVPLGPYGFHLQERGLFEKFCADYAERRRNGWIVGASHDSVLPTDAYEDSYVGRRAVEWVERVPDDFPWHLFVSFVGPHDPFDPPSEYAGRWRDAEVPDAIRDPLEGKPAWQGRRVVSTDPEVARLARRQYAAEIELIDDWVGRILDAVEGRRASERTFVVFTSDHGEMLGDHGIYTKSVAYEGAIHVPLIVAGPGIEGGRTSDALVELIDVNPTLCELAGVPPHENIDARSLAHVLRGEAAAHRTECVSAIRNFRLVRTERYKLVQNYNDLTELYDLREDPHELVNLAEPEREVARDLSVRLRDRFLEGEWLR